MGPRLIAVILLSCFAVAAQSQPSQITADAPKGSIAGTVVRASDNTPLKKAVVSLVAQPQAQQTGPVRPVTVSTDADGKFLFDKLAPGRYTLVATRNGYVRQFYRPRGAPRANMPLTLMAGQRITDIVFRLIPGGAISGRVTDEDGEPVIGAQVQAMHWVYINGRRELVASNTAVSDDRGEYRIYQLIPEQYIISAVYVPGRSFLFGGAGGEATTNEGYAPTFYPGTNDAGQAVPVGVRTGDDVAGINFRLIASKAVRVSGHVRNASGEAAGGVGVSIYSRAGTMRTGGQFDGADEHGYFELGGVMPGQYSVIADSIRDGKRVSARTDIDVGSNDIDGVLLTLRPGQEITGSIRSEGDADFKSAHLTVMLTPKEMIGRGGGGSAEVKADLTFTIADVFDGEYRLYVRGYPPTAYLRSARMGLRDVLRDGIVIRGSAPPLEIVISSGSGRLEGVVNDSEGHPFSGATVVLVPEESQRSRLDLFRAGFTDQYGKFNLRGLAPGKYRAFAWEDVEERVWQDPNFIRLYEDQGETVEIGVSAVVTRNLKLIPGTAGGS